MEKKIHYIWLGEKKKPDVVCECIASWRKFFPDWEIIEWNESNLNIDEIRYCKEAYQKKKYAFVSDYFRFWVLYKYSGLYFDTDVKVLRDFTKLINENDMFFGFEDKNNVNPGLVLYSKYKKEKLFKEILNIYEKEMFIFSDGNLNLKTVVIRFTELLRKYGLKSNNTKQKIQNMTIFPTEYFCPLDYNTGEIKITNNTYAIHLYNASWLSKEEQKEQELYRHYYHKCLKMKLNIGIARILSRSLAIYKVRGMKYLLYKIRHKINRKA